MCSVLVSRVGLGWHGISLSLPIRSERLNASDLKAIGRGGTSRKV